MHDLSNHDASGPADGMPDTTYLDPFIETLGREALEQIQLRRLQLTLDPVLRDNAFYRKKLGGVGLRNSKDLRTVADLRRLPFTTKRELSQDQAAHRPYGTNLTFPRSQYMRIHQTSGTTGEPLRWLDTMDSWRWWARCWATVYRAAGVARSGRLSGSGAPTRAPSASEHWPSPAEG
jgi:phenylacetate-CoA ligase